MSLNLKLKMESERKQLKVWSMHKLTNFSGQNAKETIINLKIVRTPSLHDINVAE